MRPLLLKKECSGFVADRLAFALSRYVLRLVNEDVTSVEDIDIIV